MKRRKKIDYMEVIMIVCILVFPLIITWTLLTFEEPTNIWEAFEICIIKIVSGIGALGIGNILVSKWMEL